MVEKYWIEGKIRGVNNNSIGPEPTSKKLSGKPNKQKEDRTQYIEYVSKKLNRLCNKCLVAQS